MVSALHSYHSRSAQSLRADIWQVGQDHVDVYLPGNTSVLSSGQLQYADTRLPRELLAVPPRHAAAYWNLSSLSNTTFHSTYHPLEDIHTFMQELLDLYPDNVNVVPIGHTAENREMFALQIFKDQRSLSKKTGFVITGAQHAREVRIQP